jgi:hypothetical protein
VRPPTRVSYWQVVLGQLRKNHVAMFAWRLVQGLLFMAVAAPLLRSTSRSSTRRGGVRTPLLSSLFDRTLFEGGVDVFFNLLLLTLPVWMLARRVFRRDDAGARLSVWRAVLLRLVVAIELFAAFGGRAAMWVAVGVVVLPGAAVLAASARSGRPSPKGARLACLALFVVGLAAIVVRDQETTLPRVWRGPSSTVGGAMLFPPIASTPMRRRTRPASAPSTGRTGGTGSGATSTAATS